MFSVFEAPPSRPSLKFVKFFQFRGIVGLPKMSEGRLLDLDLDKGRLSGY